MESPEVKSQVMIHFRRTENIELCGKVRECEVHGGYPFIGTISEINEEIELCRDVHRDALSVKVWATWK